ncbi:hypothetical protein [Lysinibacillus sp. NPDC056232]|uniref:hypothetical protein n=1 Tax=Lysinibacillus sp. NPDC056232 TaxID=3345756 RepID=UPI0035E2EC40
MKRQLQKSPSAICGEMNADLNYFSAGFQTPAEIEELSLRTPRPVAIYLCESEASATRFYLCESEASTTTTHGCHGI